MRNEIPIRAPICALHDPATAAPVRAIDPRDCVLKTLYAFRVEFEIFADMTERDALDVEIGTPYGRQLELDPGDNSR